jgi:hypothetical protein
MPNPTQLNIVVTTNAAGVFTTKTVAVPIPTALQTLDSITPGAPQTGYSAVDQLVRSIFRAEVFTDNQGNWFPTSTIQSITFQ